MLALLHLCDSLFPIGSFSHSDGLEGATARRLVTGGRDLEDWMTACLDEVLARAEGPAVREAWEAARASCWDRIERIDAEMHALRPSAAARSASRSMGGRLVRTWQRIRPSDRLQAFIDWNDDEAVTLPVAFGLVTAIADVEIRAALEGFMYTRLAATISCAMRLLPIGQHEAHVLLAAALRRVPAIVDSILERTDPPMQFTPMLDLAALHHRSVHSRLFRS